MLIKDLLTPYEYEKHINNYFDDEEYKSMLKIEASKLLIDTVNITPLAKSSDLRIILLSSFKSKRSATQLFIPC